MITKSNFIIYQIIPILVHALSLVTGCAEARSGRNYQLQDKNNLRSHNECSDPTYIHSTLKYKENVSDTFLTYAATPDEDSISKNKTLELSGPCVEFIYTYGVNGAQMSTGFTIDFPPYSPPKVVPSNPGAYENYNVINTEMEHPHIEGMEFVRATKVLSIDNWKSGAYLGHWHNKNGHNVIASFIKNSDKSFQKPEILIYSSSPLKAVNYFPSPDTFSGDIYILQNENRHVKLFSVLWTHRSINQKIITSD